MLQNKVSSSVRLKIMPSIVVALRGINVCRLNSKISISSEVGGPRLLREHILPVGWTSHRISVFFQRLFLRSGLVTLTQRRVASVLCTLILGFMQPSLKAFGGWGGSNIPQFMQSKPSTAASTRGGVLSLLSPELNLHSLSSIYTTTAIPFTVATSLLTSVWRAEHLLCCLPIPSADAQEIRPDHLLLWVGLGLRLTYRIRYHALDRKIRKIVKNKYRYVRSYVCIREAQRVRYGLRLLPLGALLCPERRWEVRLGVLLQTLMWNPQQSVVRQLRQQHQQTALSALGLV